MTKRENEIHEMLLKSFTNNQKLAEEMMNESIRCMEVFEQNTDNIMPLVLSSVLKHYAMRIN